MRDTVTSCLLNESKARFASATSRMGGGELRSEQ